MKPSLLVLLSVTGVTLLSSAQAQIDVGLSAEIRIGRAQPPPPPEVVIVEDTRPPGPPPWAPAHGFRKNREYYYYPGTDVYYRPADRTWFYLDGGNWRVGTNLPSSVHVDFGRSVSLSMESERPYEFHEKVRSYYPRDYFVSKVRMKEKGGKAIKAEKADSSPRDRDRDGARGSDKDNGPGKGKGRGKDK
jgi:hypothetical protein